MTQMDGLLDALRAVHSLTRALACSLLQVRASEAARNAKPELVDSVISADTEWRKGQLIAAGAALRTLSLRFRGTRSLQHCCALLLQPSSR